MNKRIPVIDITLINALTELDIWLKKNKLSIEMKILGGTALHLHDIQIARATTDIDLANKITDDSIWETIKQIGRHEGMEENWIECTDVAIPKDSSFIKHPIFKQFDCIEGSYIDLKSLVITKIACYYDRLHIQLTDINDIEQAISEGFKLTEELINKGIQFIRDTRPSPIDEERLEGVKQDLESLADNDAS